MLYNRRLLFVLKLAQNLARLDAEAREQAFEQFPEDVVDDVKRTIALKARITTRKPKDG